MPPHLKGKSPEWLIAVWPFVGRAQRDLQSIIGALPTFLYTFKVVPAWADASLLTPWYDHDSPDRLSGLSKLEVLLDNARHAGAGYPSCSDQCPAYILPATCASLSHGDSCAFRGASSQSFSVRSELKSEIRGRRQGVPAGHQMTKSTCMHGSSGRQQRPHPCHDVSWNKLTFPAFPATAEETM